MREANESKAEGTIPAVPIESKDNVSETKVKATKDKGSKDKPSKDKGSKDKHAKLIYIDSGKAGELKKIVLAKDENDPDWDPKMLLPVPDSLVDGLAVHGWDESMPLRVKPVKIKGETFYKVTQGRTKMRALEEANKRRTKAKLQAIQVPVTVIEGEEEIEGMRVAVRLNEHQRHTDPITKALAVERYFAAGLTEADAAHDMGLTSKQVVEHYELLKLPKSVQKLVQSGKMAISAALGLVHVDAKKVEAVAQRLVDQAESVGKVTQRDARAAVEGNEKAPDRLNAKQVKALIDEIEATTIGGKHGKAAVKVGVMVLECVLDARKRGKIIARLQEVGQD